jgi:hypothetical protein
VSPSVSVGRVTVDPAARFGLFRRPALPPASLRDLVPAEFRPDEEERRVTRVTILVEWEGGDRREYDAVEPLDFKLSPGLAASGPHSAGAKLSVSFRVDPRWNLRIWTPGRTSRDGIRDGVERIAEMLGCCLQPAPGLRSGVEAAARIPAEQPGEGG